MLASNIEKLLKALHKHEVEFVIIGGAAAVIQGSAYVTGDLDICYSRNDQNLKNLEMALAPYNCSLRGAPKNLPFRLDAVSLKSGLNFTLTTDLGALDLLGEVAGLGGYAELLSFSEELELYGIGFKVLTLEGLIKNKRIVGRQKDLMLLPELEALLELRESKNKLKWNSVICEAIRKKAVIQFDYHGITRAVEPQSHGISTAGNEVIRGIQINPRSTSGKPIEGRLYMVSEMSDLKQTNETFLTPGPHFNPNDKGMSYVHCSLAQVHKAGD